jgi:putative oxidoreductase
MTSPPPSSPRPIAPASPAALAENSAPLGPVARQGNTAFAVSVALLLLRLALGWTFIYHGSQKAFGWFGGPGMAGFAKGMDAMSLPLLSGSAWAYIAAYGELLGGLTIFLGLLARLGTLPIIATMLVAVATVHGKNGFSSGNGGFEYNLNLIAMCAVILLAGPGLISLDALLFRRGFWARGPQPLSEPGKRG